MKVRTEYRYCLRFGRPTHTFLAEGARGAVHLHATDTGEELAQKYGGPRWTGGIEFHSRTPTSDAPPDHVDCWVLRAPCWHDGSSMQFEEWYSGLFHDDMSMVDIKMILQRVEGEYRGWVARMEEDEA